MQTLRIERVFCLKKLSKRDPEKYVPLFFKELRELGEDHSFFAMQPKRHTLLHYIAKHNCTEKLEELHATLPQLVESEINKGRQKPLKYAFLHADLSLAKKLVERGADINACNDSQLPILLELVVSNPPHLLEALQFCVSTSNIKLDAVSLEKRNLLHLMAINPSITEDVVDYAFSVQAIRVLADQPDVYGFRPVDYAYFAKNHFVLSKILGNSVIDITDQRYGNFPLRISQGIVLDQIKKFLEMTRSKKELESAPFYQCLSKGYCYAFVFLFFYYFDKNKSSLFYEILETIFAWDGQKASLKIPIAPSQLCGLYATLEDLFNQTLNDLVWLQGAGVKLRKDDCLPIDYTHARITRYGLICNREKDPILEKVVDRIILYLDENQLAEWLEIFSHFPHHLICVHANNHNVGFIPMEDGSLVYYEPNFKYRIMPQRDFNELAILMKKILHDRFNLDRREMCVAFQVFKMTAADAPPLSLENVEKLMQRASPNRFTPLHLAVLLNQQTLFDTLMSRLDPSEITQVDHNTYRPIYYAALMKRSTMFVALLHTDSIAHEELSFVIETGQEEMFCAYIKHPCAQLEYVLIECCRQRRLDFAQKIIESGKPLNRSRIACRCVISFLLNDENFEAVKLLLRSRQYPDRDLYRWVKANYHQSPELVIDVLQAMPDIDLCDSFMEDNLYMMARDDENEIIMNLIRNLRGRRDSAG